MITNGNITYYHKTLNNTTKLEEWTKYEFSSVWYFKGKAVTQNNGLENSNNIQVRIPMKYVNDSSIFNVGDIILIGTGNSIEKQSDLQDLDFYNVTSVNINNFGTSPHIHLAGG